MGKRFPLPDGSRRGGIGKNRCVSERGKNSGHKRRRRLLVGMRREPRRRHRPIKKAQEQTDKTAGCFISPRRKSQPLFLFEGRGEGAVAKRGRSRGLIIPQTECLQ